MMKITTYIKKNYKKLPKSTFNNQELVIVQTITDKDWGYGNHNYESIGINKDGQIFWCYSSGCSCDGTCGLDHKKDLKVLATDGFDLSKLDGSTLNFQSMQVEFSDY